MKQLKKVYKYTSDYKLVDAYESVKSAIFENIHLRIAENTLRVHCSHKTKQYGKLYAGFIWRYTPLKNDKHKAYLIIYHKYS